MNIRRGRLTSACMVAMIACLLAGCKQSPRAPEMVLNLGNYAEPQDLDPHIITGVTELNIISALLEGLVDDDPRDLHPVPGVAQRWDISADGLTYAFHLRPDAKWSNGDRMTSRDFSWSFRRMLSPGLGAEYAYMLYPMKGAEDFNKGRSTDTASLGMQTPDDSTLVIILGKPTPYFLSLLSHNAWMPVHRATIEKFGTMDQRGTAWTKQGNFVGNGPFILKTWRVNTVVSVVKSPTYWDRATVKLDEINFYPYESVQTEERAFRSGQLNVTYSVPLNLIDFYKKEHPDRIHIDPYLATYFYRFNTTRRPFDDVRVRRALAMAVDRPAITKDILKGGQLPAYYFTPPGTAGYTARCPFAADIAAAQKLLAEAGYPGGRGFPEIELLFNTSDQHLVIAQAVQEMWKNNLGIAVRLVNQEWKVYLETQKELAYGVCRSGWTGDYNDPNTFLDMWVTGGGNNQTGWSNAVYDSLIRQASMTADAAQRFECFQQAEAVLMREMPIMPIYFYTSLSLRDPRVKGFWPTILNKHPYKYIYIE